MSARCSTHVQGGQPDSRLLTSRTTAFTGMAKSRRQLHHHHYCPHKHSRLALRAAEASHSTMPSPSQSEHAGGAGHGIVQQQPRQWYKLLGQQLDGLLCCNSAHDGRHAMQLASSKPAEHLVSCHLSLLGLYCRLQMLLRKAAGLPFDRAAAHSDQAGCPECSTKASLVHAKHAQHPA